MESVAQNLVHNGYICSQCEFKCVNESSQRKHEKANKKHIMVEARLRARNSNVQRLTSNNLVVVPDRGPPPAAEAALKVLNASLVKKKGEKDQGQESADVGDVNWGATGELVGLITELGWADLIGNRDARELLHSHLIGVRDKDLKEWNVDKQFQVWWAKVWKTLKRVPVELKWLATADGGRNVATLWKAPETEVVLERRKYTLLRLACFQWSISGVDERGDEGAGFRTICEPLQFEELIPRILA